MAASSVGPGYSTSSKPGAISKKNSSGGSDRKVHVLDTRNQRVLFTSELLQHSVSAIGFVGEGTVVFGIGERPGPVARPS